MRKSLLVVFMFLMVFLVGCTTKPVSQPVETNSVNNTNNEDMTNNNPTYKMSEVASHNTASDCWSVVRGQVYDLTEWIAKHPGGEAAITQLCGVDGTDKFVGKHGGSSLQENTLAEYKIGDLSAEQ